MADVEKLIEKIMTSLRRTEIHLDEAATDGAYRDEPIIKTARAAAEELPETLAKMKKIGAYDERLQANEAALFVKQGEFAADFEDSYEKEAVFSRYFPTYRHMSDRQLRAYFTWRAAVRRGDVRETSLSYAFVYIYELINLIGVNDAQDAAEKLDRFVEQYSPYERSLRRYTDRWRRDMTVYYGVAAKDDGASRAVAAIDSPESVSDEELFTSLAALSSYNMEKSPLVKRRPEDAKLLIPRVLRSFSAFCAEHRKTPLSERVLGKKTTRAYVIFPSAVFYDPHRAEDFVYTDPSGRIYRRHAGAWSVTGYPEVKKKSAELGALIKEIDLALRAALDGENDKDVPGVIAKIARREAAALEEERRRAEAEKVEFDFSKLGEIRRSADETARALIIDESDEVPDDAEEEKEEEKEEETEDAAPEDARSPLSDEERGLVRVILDGGDAASYAKARGKMLSVMVDAANEKLFDEFLDNVIDFDGYAARVIEDYKEDLKGFI